MSDDSTNNQNNLDVIGYQLGLIDDDERREIEAASQGRLDLASQCKAVDAWLAPLAADEFEPPADLAARIEARLAANRRPYLQPAGDETTAAKTPFLSGRDLLALAAVITLFVGVFFPTYREARFRAEQAACANNLRSIGWAAGNYGVAAGDNFPFTGTAAPTEFWYRQAPHSGSTSLIPYEQVSGNYDPATADADSGMRIEFPVRDPAAGSLDAAPDLRNVGYDFGGRVHWRPWVQIQFVPRVVPAPVDIGTFRTRGLDGGYIRRDAPIGSSDAVFTP